MDPASFVGIGLALFSLMVAMIMDGGQPGRPGRALFDTAHLRRAPSGPPLPAC